jgi:antitoxin Phd
MTRLLTSQITRGDLMKSWPVQDAKARFSEFLKASLTEGPQVVTLRGVEAAVLVPMSEWRSLRERARPGLKALLLADSPRRDLELPARGRLRRRAPQEDG